jgi:hypothetical protein
MYSGIAAALISALIAVLAVSSANAASYTHTGDNFASLQTSSLLTLAGYYDRGDGHGGHEGDYDDGGYDEPGGHHACGHTRYKKKYVCEQDEPRCFKQRECIWYWGREYCRYVRKWVGGKSYCRWVKTPVHSKCW